jgi:outer membrane lipoprotein SlyB
MVRSYWTTLTHYSPSSRRTLTLATNTHSSDVKGPISRQKVTLSCPSSGSTVQVEGTSSHPSKDPVGNIVRCPVVGNMVGVTLGASVGVVVGEVLGFVVGTIVGAKLGLSVGQVPQNPNSRAS